MKIPIPLQDCWEKQDVSEAVAAHERCSVVVGTITYEQPESSTWGSRQRAVGMKKRDMAPDLSKGENKSAMSNVRKKWETSKEKGTTMYQELYPYSPSSAPCNAI